MNIQHVIQKIVKKFPTFKTAESHIVLSNMVPLRDPTNLKTREEIYEWIREGITHFKEWYQPVDFGNGVRAYATTPPDWKPQLGSLDDNEVGLMKWKYRVERHIPNLAGKRVLDLGCSSGVFSIEMARLGAKEVVGIDRDVTIQHRSTTTPPPQNVIAQAEFVKKAFELLEGKQYPITYMVYDIGKLDTLDIGRFDLVLGLNIVYHELDNMPRLVSHLGTITNHLVLQSSLGHGNGALGKWAGMPMQVETLLKAGFTHIEIDAPKGYPLPIIIGKK